MQYYLFLEDDAYHRQDDQELMTIPGSDETLHDQEGTGENSRCRSWMSAFQMACSFALAFFRDTMSHYRLTPPAALGIPSICVRSSPGEPRNLRLI